MALAGGCALQNWVLHMLVIFLLAVYGLANSIAVLKAGKMVRNPLEALSDFWAGSLWGLPWRFLTALVKCPPCLSFWIGIAGSWWVLSPSMDFIVAHGKEPWVAAIVDGLAACGASWILHVAAMRMCIGIENILDVEKVKEI
jgi:hypothetical protein